MIGTVPVSHGAVDKGRPEYEALVDDLAGCEGEKARCRALQVVVVVVDERVRRNRRKWTGRSKKKKK